MEEPRLIQGGLSVDDRGEVGFVGEFDFAGVKRFYTVRNHGPGQVRAWHAHKKEGKYVHVVQGAALVGAVRIDDWNAPAKEADVFRTVLSDRKPAILYVPPGYANGFMSLSPDTKVVFFSTSSLTESENDDYRFDARYWDIWQVEER